VTTKGPWTDDLIERIERRLREIHRIAGGIELAPVDDIRGRADDIRSSASAALTEIERARVLG
jgi:hypothetical protein